MKKVVIVGAGIGGLALANLLAKAGYDVHVYEKNDHPGGRAGLLEVDGFRFDTGPSWYLMPNVFEHYYELLDTTVQEQFELKRLSPAYKVFFEHNDPLIITSSLDADAATFEKIEKGSGRALRAYVKKSHRIYQLALRHFLYTNFRSPLDVMKFEVVQHGITMLKLAYTPIDAYVSRYVSDRRLKQILEYPMVFLGASPFTAPALYSLMSALDFKEGVYYPKGGMYQVTDSLFTLGKQLGVSYYFDADVSKIEHQNKRATGIRLESGKTVDADIVVSNADMHHTETQMLDNAGQSYPETYWEKKQASPSALLMYIGIKGSLPQFVHHNLLFVDDWQENFAAIYDQKVLPENASLYICKPSHTDETVAPSGHENVFVLIPLPAGVSVDAATQRELADRYIEQIKTMTGVDLSQNVVVQKLFGPNDFRTKYYAWQSTMLGPSHVLRQSALFRTPNASKKLKNLYYVGASTTPGIGVPMCLIGAELVYKRLIGDQRGGRVKVVRPLKKEQH